MNNMLVNAIEKNSASGNSASGTEYRVSDNSASDNGRGHDIASQPVGQIPGSQICVEGQWTPISASGSHTGIQPDVMMSVYLSGSAPAASEYRGIAPGQGRIRRLANGSFTGFGLLSTLGLAACITDGTGGTSGGGLPGDDADIPIPEVVDVDTPDAPALPQPATGETQQVVIGDLDIELELSDGTSLDPQSAAFEEFLDNQDLSNEEKTELVEQAQDQIAEAATEWAGEAAAAIAGAVEGLDAVAPDADTEAPISDIRDLMASAAQSAAGDSGDGDNGGFDVDVGRLVVSSPLLPNDGDGYQADPIEYGLDPLLFALMEQHVEMAEGDQNEDPVDDPLFDLDLSEIGDNSEDVADNQGLYLPLGIYSASNPYEQYSAFIPFVGRQKEDPESDEMALGEFVQNITGTAYADLISGNDRDNIIDGGEGNDILAGGFGDDTLNGDAGNDILRGGAGADKFTLALDIAAGTDTITDFSVAEGDKLVVDTVNGDETTLADLGLSAQENDSNSADANILFSGAVIATLYDVDYNNITDANFADYFEVI